MRFSALLRIEIYFPNGQNICRCGVSGMSHPLIKGKTHLSWQNANTHLKRIKQWAWRNRGEVLSLRCCVTFLQVWEGIEIYLSCYLWNAIMHTLPFLCHEGKVDWCCEFQVNSSRRALKFGWEAKIFCPQTSKRTRSGSTDQLCVLINWILVWFGELEAATEDPSPEMLE